MQRTFWKSSAEQDLLLYNRKQCGNDLQHFWGDSQQFTIKYLMVVTFTIVLWIFLDKTKSSIGIHAICKFAREFKINADFAMYSSWSCRFTTLTVCVSCASCIATLLLTLENGTFFNLYDFFLLYGAPHMTCRGRKKKRNRICSQIDLICCLVSVKSSSGNLRMHSWPHCTNLFPKIRNKLVQHGHELLKRGNGLSCGNNS